MRQETEALPWKKATDTPATSDCNVAGIYHERRFAMAERSKRVRIEITVKDRGTVWLRLDADDEYTTYLSGKWTFLKADPSDDDIYENGPEELAEAVLGSKKPGPGKFTRGNGSPLLRINGTRVILGGVDTMHGLSWGGRGVATLDKKLGGGHHWMAHTN
jgi:hypothetical protein